MAASKKSAKVNKTTLIFSKTRIIVFIILTVIFLSSLFFSAFFENIINGKGDLNSIDYNSGLRITLIDVDHGDGIFVKLPDNKTMLIDAGADTTASKTKYQKYIKEKLNDGDVVDYLIMTHSDADHIGSIPFLFEYLQINTVYRPNVYSSKSTYELPHSPSAKVVTTNVYKDAIDALYQEQNCNVKFNAYDDGDDGLNIIESNYDIKFYSPDLDFYDETNNYSPIIVLNYMGKKVCLTGDAEKENEAEAIANAIPACDILKAGHHGSNTSSISAFISRISPVYVLISCSDKYDLPNPNAIARIAQNAPTAKIITTYEVGNIYIIVNASTLSCNMLVIGFEPYVVKWAYVVIALITVSFTLCFIIKYKNKEKTK